MISIGNGLLFVGLWHLGIRAGHGAPDAWNHMESRGCFLSSIIPWYDNYHPSTIHHGPSIVQLVNIPDGFTTIR